MTLILGGGLTGITAAYALHRAGRRTRVLEADSQPGGASRTLVYEDEFRFDLGGHRLYTRLPDVIGLVKDLVGKDLLDVPRQSRIYLQGKFADYPLSFKSALSALGIGTTLGVAGSYAWERVKRLCGGKDEVTFEDWVVSRFGRKLYSIYFAPYSEKVWGVACDRLSADFAAQRIRGLSLREAVVKALFSGGEGPATLAQRFWYPRLGFGRIPETMVERMAADTVVTDARVTEARHSGGRIESVFAGGRTFEAETFVSTIPISDLAAMLRPEAPPEILNAARRLKFRDLIVVFLALDRERVTADQWIYFPSPSLAVGRMHEPANWSADMSPDGYTSLVAEVFCFKEDAVWREDDASLIRRVSEELAGLGLIRTRDVMGGMVERIPRAYPVYEMGYEASLTLLLEFMGRFKNLVSAGRSGLFRYTSGDYCMECGLRAAENVMGAGHDLFSIGAAQEYAEK